MSSGVSGTPSAMGAVVQATPEIIGSMFKFSEAETAMQNSSMFYQSEEGQGLHTFYAGIAIIVVGYFMKSWLVGIAGGIVAIFGHNRMNRASDTYNKATLEYAKSIGPKL